MILSVSAQLVYRQVGSDIPGITADIVSEAFATVAPQSDSETVGPSSPLVLGPALDGGYYLLAAHCDMQHKLGRSRRILLGFHSFVLFFGCICICL